MKTAYLLGLSKPQLIFQNPKNLKASFRTLFKRSRIPFAIAHTLYIIVFVFSFVSVFTPIAFTSEQKHSLTRHSETFSLTSKWNGLAQVLRSNGVLLRPQIVGRVGNQMFEWAAAWGIAQQLRANLNNSLPVALVVQSTNGLYT